MGVFSKRRKVTIEDFCREFYDFSILGNTKIVEGFDHNAPHFINSYRDMLIEVDPGFQKTNIKLFSKLFLALRFETFALAWMHKFGDNTSFPQSEFTKKYLFENHKADIWDAMAAFNQAAARSVTAGYKEDTPEGRQRIGFITTLRHGYVKEMMEELVQKGIDPHKMDAADRDAIFCPINRLDSEPAWKSGMTPGYLMLAWGRELKHEFNEKGQETAIRMIRGFYDGAYESFDNITLVAS